MKKEELIKLADGLKVAHDKLYKLVDGNYSSEIRRDFLNCACYRDMIDEILNNIEYYSKQAGWSNCEHRIKMLIKKYNA